MNTLAYSEYTVTLKPANHWFSPSIINIVYPLSCFAITCTMAHDIVLSLWNRPMAPSVPKIQVMLWWLSGAHPGHRHKDNTSVCLIEALWKTWWSLSGLCCLDWPKLCITCCNGWIGPNRCIKQNIHFSPRQGRHDSCSLWPISVHWAMLRGREPNSTSPLWKPGPTRKL